MADKMKKGAKEIRITGFIEEIELEDGGQGLQLDDGDHTYIIVMDKIGNKMERYIDEEVDVTGMMTKSGGMREIKVSAFRLTDDYNDDDNGYDEGDDSYYDDYDDDLDDRL